mgnify:CR=1 FL=1
MNLLQMKQITKTYNANKVLDQVSLSIKEGEIHGLVGENGAGKSTLMNILFGMPVIHSTGGFEGEILINGEPFTPHSPKAAMDMGIGMVHQEFMLIPGFTVTENVKLNREKTKPSFLSRIFGRRLEQLDKRTMAEDTKIALDKLNMTIDEYARVAGLPVGHMQFIEIAREVDKDTLKLLILDEPTAVLTESESTQFLAVARRLADMGISILFISHRLDEIKQITDSITILRDGELVKTVDTNQIEIVDIARLMVGREIKIAREDHKDQKVAAEPILELKGFKVNMPGEKVRGIDLQVRKGEILGIGGLAGHGKLGIANGIMGLYEASGTIIKDNNELPLNNPRKALAASIAFLSEDRRGVGLLLDDSIGFNIVFSSLELQDKFTTHVGPIRLIDNDAVKEHAEKMIEALDIRCTSYRQKVRYLSGGNQQKVCVARALTLEPDLLLVSEPTRGIDIGAKKLVLDTLVNLNREFNMTIIITSSELGELRQIADRIAIIYNGQVSGILPYDASDEEFGLLMTGKKLGELNKAVN